MVYVDDCYHCSWVYPKATRKIVDYLISDERGNKKFAALNAEGLKEWVALRIEKNNANKTVVVFAQDMVPEPLAPDSSPSIILRKYLDYGGRIVWLGNIPFFHQGKFCEDLKKHSVRGIKSSRTDVWVEWSVGGIFSILGINVEFNYSPTEKVEITSLGEQWGLRKENKWYGTRPIAETEHNIKILAESSAKRYKPAELIKPEEKKSIIDNLTETTNKIAILSGILLSFLTALFTFYSILAQNQLPSWLPPLLSAIVFVVLSVFFISLPKIHESYKNWRKKKYPNAWIKNFNNEFPDSGFVRLWDTQIYDVEQSDLEDLLAVATHNI